ncbi:uncharacterized protein B0H18DRAFT_870424 [Fomitopsis serialis]|uniref:uncharacterized protein n=1 Tax=Fomitopsis serialis TaxID=139415 RepID=UPI0020080B23|nr:uncharacterized protein B0H18DRAFT_870424 [Neoantrodia serialis]KAH9933849.1 hypothetical protein B0H18DRAFT_870424 [Neoantrodia serialis]
MVKRKRTFDELLGDTCGACHQPFRTTQGLCAHQTMSKKCSWYKKGKLKEIFTVKDHPVALEDGVISEHVPNPSPEEDANEDLEEEEEDDEDLSSLYDFIEVCAPSKPPGDPGGYGDGHDDVSAGKVTGVDEEVRRRWLEGREGGRSVVENAGETRAEDATDGEGTAKQPKNPWEPFESEMDWRFASWAIQEGLTQGSIDRALEIPGFKERLGLSYHNSRSLLQRVDSLPERAEWIERCLSFKDRPNERHLLQFRDIIQAIRTLLGNPEHTDQIVYRPRRIFSDASRKHRLYNEMWTGRWWHAVQVSALTSVHRPKFLKHL